MFRFSPTSGEELGEENSSVDMIQSALHDIIFVFDWTTLTVNTLPSLAICNVHFVKFHININKYVDTKQQS